MGRCTHGRLTGISIAMLALGGGLAAQDGGPDDVLRLQVIDKAGVDADILQEARTQLDKIYWRAGVSIIWNGPNSETSPLPAGLRLTVVLTSGGVAGVGARNSMWLGHALSHGGSGARWAYVFTDRVQALAAQAHDSPFTTPVRRTEGLVLGLAIAHEVGHMMLPSGHHSVTGVMSPSLTPAGIDEAQRGALLFTADEGHLLRAVFEANRIDLADIHDGTAPVTPTGIRDAPN